MAGPDALFQVYSMDCVDLCICSYRRPEIIDTLKAVARQTGISPARLRVIVADNTPAGDMKDRIQDSAKSLGLALTYVHAPANNISIARNACLDAARSPWIAFLDDDELPTPDWLGELLAEGRRRRWDAVLGPVRAIYSNDAPLWARSGDFHSTAPVWVKGEIRTAYTGNVIFRRSLIEREDLRFRTDLGRSGGEDNDFFDRFFEAGGRIGFAQDAIVYEHVPTNRVTLAWLLRRSFRRGQSHGSHLARRGDRLADIAIAFSKAALCSAAALVSVGHAVRRMRFMIRAALHIGVVARLAGLREIDVY